MLQFKDRQDSNECKCKMSANVSSHQSNKKLKETKCREKYEYLEEG
jgi:hypothetical protein